MRKLSAVVVACAAAGVVAAASAASTASSTAVVFHLVEKDSSFHLVDNPPLQGPNRAPTAGDQFVFVSTLWTRSGKRAGTLRATCAVTEGGQQGATTCYGTFGLRGGQLEGMATVLGDAKVTNIAIVGGTGAYAGVRGTVKSVSRGEESPFSDDTFTLVR